jgi:hypothetical protein
MNTHQLTKQQELALLQQRLALQEMLPHRFGMPWYTWAWDFYQSRNHMEFLCAGNQISKSSTQIRKAIEWATNKEIWAELWPDTLSMPNAMWYFYPTKDVVNDEFRLKWLQFLPKDKEHPVYGWKEVKDKGKINEIQFKSGMTIFFKSYAQDVKDLQTGTIYAIFCDEELPVALFPELQARLNATDGYFHMAFTATIGQEFWRKTIEPKGDEPENFPKAAKWQIDLERGDCTWYMDGTPSPWTKEKVQKAIERCSTPAEKARRVNGKFVVEGGLRYESFDRDRNQTPRHPLPRSWLVFSGIDYGSGGEKGHPSAICFVGVSPDFRQGRVFLGRRFDEVVTTAGDVIESYAEMAKKLPVVLAAYDFSATDLYTIASRVGLSLTKADKSRDRGTDLLNTLFKAGVLKIFEDDPELGKLVTELTSLKKEIHKSDAVDDFIDALRYAVMAIPWDHEYLAVAIKQLDDSPPDPEIIETKPKNDTDLRREFYLGREDTEASVEDELQEWADLFEGGIEY